MALYSQLGAYGQIYIFGLAIYQFSTMKYFYCLEKDLNGKVSYCDQCIYSFIYKYCQTKIIDTIRSPDVQF